MPEVQAGKTKIYFSNLDGLRFFCFLAVFLFHSIYSEKPEIYTSPLFRFLKDRLFHNGFLGVNFFFVLSGFLITYLLIKEKQLHGKINVPNFWIRRILRIWPLYFACVFLGFVIFPLAKKFSGGASVETANIWYYLGFINNFDYINKGMPDSPGLGVLWSIAIEEQFYLVWPLILALLPVKRYWIAFTVIILHSWYYRAGHDVPILHEMHTFSCIGDMATGALGAWLVSVSVPFRNFINRIPRAVILLFYLAFFGIIFLRQDILLGNQFIRIFERSILAFTIIFIILEQCFAETSFVKMSSLKQVTNWGVITYGLYCLHFIIISLVTGATKKLGLDQQLWQVVLLQPLISLALTIAVAWLSYRFFELPFLKLKNRFSYIVKE